MRRVFCEELVRVELAAILSEHVRSDSEDGPKSMTALSQVTLVLGHFLNLFSYITLPVQTLGKVHAFCHQCIFRI